jgi:2-polyprenyl-3-methyl-5-hydroxy-6-metoxy-1,4-benzoquinol methylase
VRRAAKTTVVALARVLGLPWRLVPFALRRAFVRALLVVESRIGPPRNSLARLFALSDDLELVVNERATAYGHGSHPKHRLIPYHDFFVDRIPPGSRVLDLGCGAGEVARSIAERVPGVSVTAVDSNADAIQRARASAQPANLKFVLGDATRDLDAAPCDVIVLSNVWEHLADRVGFLGGLVRRSAPKRVLIRVPLFERHPNMALRRELGVNYFSDPTHTIEHTLAEFEREVADSGLVIVERQTLWGEIWAWCEHEST